MLTTTKVFLAGLVRGKRVGIGGGGGLGTWSLHPPPSHGLSYVRHGHDRHGTRARDFKVLLSLGQAGIPLRPCGRPPQPHPTPFSWGAVLRT